MKYKNKVRSRISNLKDPKNPGLRRNVLAGNIDLGRIASMSAEEMASEELKQLRNVLTQEAIREHQMAKTGGTSSDMFQCSKCRKKNCTYNQRTTSVAYADKLIHRSIRFINGLGERPGTKVLAAENAISEGRLGTVVLTDNSKIVTINRQQFIRSLSNNLSHRMFTTASSRGAASQAQSDSDYVHLLAQLKVLERDNWPPAQTMPPGYGEVQRSRQAAAESRKDPDPLWRFL
ncbi:hypothetical protein KUCAC02_013731 [Chaenocephalus aceratus]|uniref:Uncharacterized protein n=1 Tax=Chaenocephalus aceratus TaxID=36190 RepID=A0ACB9WBR7_CHAAC|nr:hypothetical protein KUCAC02_013731 [Chaenocephalus aceratus]